MNKNDFKGCLIDELRNQGLELTNVAVGKILDGFQDAVMAALVEDGSLKLSGFMNLQVEDVAERDRRNPKTGEMVHCPASKKIKAKIMPKFLEDYIAAVD